MIHVRIFIHLREDLAKDEHYAVFGRIDKKVNEVRILDCQTRRLQPVSGGAQALPYRSADGGLMEYIKKVSWHDDTFILLVHNPGDEYHDFDHEALHVYADKFKVEAGTASMYVFAHYLNELTHTFPDLYFS